MKENIYSKENLSDLKEKQNNFISSNNIKIDRINYNSLLEYIKFLSVQDGHFDLHNAIGDINLRVDGDFSGKLLLDIRFKTSKSISDLKSIKIKNWDDENSTILPVYLLGERDRDCKLYKANGKFSNAGYIGKELIASEKYIKDFIDIENHMAGIYDLEENLLFPERT